MSLPLLFSSIVNKSGYTNTPDRSDFIHTVRPTDLWVYPQLRRQNSVLKKRTFGVKNGNSGKVTNLLRVGIKDSIIGNDFQLTNLYNCCSCFIEVSLWILLQNNLLIHENGLVYCVFWLVVFDPCVSWTLLTLPYNSLHLLPPNNVITLLTATRTFHQLLIYF